MRIRCSGLGLLFCVASLSGVHAAEEVHPWKLWYQQPAEKWVEALPVGNGRPILHLLPALPSAWPRGRITGLCARGGFEVDLTWQDGELTSVQVSSGKGTDCLVRYRDKSLALAFDQGEQKEMKRHDF